MTQAQTIGELLAELDADPELAKQASEWAESVQFNAVLRDLQQAAGDVIYTRRLHRQRALNEIADHYLDEGLPQTESAILKKRKYVTQQEAEQIARQKYKKLWTIGNKSEWARQIGCSSETVGKLKAWHDAEHRRQNWRKTATRLESFVDPKIIEALATGDASVIASLSEKERDRFDKLPDAERSEMLGLLTESAYDAD